MEIISSDEAAKIPKRLHNRNSPVRNMILQLQVGQYLKVEKKDWSRKTKGPAAICRIVERYSKMRFECYEMLDKTGWIIKRIV